MHHELAWLVSSDDRVEESSVFFAAHLGGVMVCSYAVMQLEFKELKELKPSILPSRAPYSKIEHNFMKIHVA